MKVLCIGNNTENTDFQTNKLAKEMSSVCHGLIANPSIQLENGYYHTSIHDLEFTDLLELGKQFDQIIILDQAKAEYLHSDAFYNTIKLGQELLKFKPVNFLNKTVLKEISFFQNLVQSNPSFCIYPFIELVVNNSNTTVCCRSSTTVTKIKDLRDFQTDNNYNLIRNKMISGKLVPEHCSSCYKTESMNMISARQQETVEWANRLNLTNLDDLSKIKTPTYYEIRPGNLCNLQCRMCHPAFSERINQEYFKLNLIDKKIVNSYTGFEIVDFTNLKKLYIAGGEPTVMLELYEFLDRCIENNKTDFEFVINTNATKINRQLKKRLQYFKNLQFIISIDGVDQLNYYIRWPSKWDNIIKNVSELILQGYTVSINTTVSIYNISNLYQILHFFDSTWPGILIHCQLAEFDLTSNKNILSALNFPDADIVLKNLLEIKDLKCYKNNRLLSSFIDGLILHYQNKYTLDIDSLKQFFEFNDKLDYSRNVFLKDYIPELEQARSLIN